MLKEASVEEFQRITAHGRESFDVHLLWEEKNELLELYSENDSPFMNGI